MEQMDERTVISSSDNNSTRLPFFEELVWCCPCCSSSQSESEHCSLCVNLHWDKILTDDAALELTLMRKKWKRRKKSYNE
jgi:hypothetical protein